MNVSVIIVTIVVILLCGIVLFGAPFLPTKRAQIATALNLLDLRKGQLLYDLGAGDGRVALAAAKKGLRVVGYEMNILLVILARLKTRKYKSLVSIRLQSYWSADFRACDGVYTFSSSRYMKRLDKKLSGAKKSIKLASFAFEIPNKKCLKHSNGVFLYQY